MSKRFLVELYTIVCIELHDDVLNAVNDDWRKNFYNLTDSKQIAEHIAYNMVINDAKLSQLDGWADQPNDNAEILLSPKWDVNVLEEQ